MLEAITPKYLQKLLQIAAVDNGGGNWVRGSLHPLFIDLQSVDIRDCVNKWNKAGYTVTPVAFISYVIIFIKVFALLTCN